MNDYADIRIGDRVRFKPGSHGNRWWTVRDRDNRFIVATMQAPFEPKGQLCYTVVDLTGWQQKRYNGAGNGVVRSSLNTLGGGWDLGPNGEGSERIIPALHSGEWELSNRRVISVWSFDHSPMPRPVEAHQFDPGHTGMSETCNRLVLRDGSGDDCGLPRGHQTHEAAQ